MGLQVHMVHRRPLRPMKAEGVESKRVESSICPYSFNWQIYVMVRQPFDPEQLDWEQTDSSSVIT